MADIGWGHLSDKESFGRPIDQKGDFEEVTFTVAMTKYKEYMHASHCAIHAPDSRILWKMYPQKAAILMQMRFDGAIGFPGGLLDKGTEDPVEALNREMEEEIGLDLSQYSVTQDDHISSHVNHKKKMVCHFYGKSVTYKQFCDIERNVLNSTDWGIETYGMARVPLYIMGDGERGLPLFLLQKFAGNAKDQLLITIRRRKILSEEELDQAVKLSEQLAASSGS